MYALGDILKVFIKEYGLEKGLTLQRIRSRWRELVGETVAAHTSPDRLSGNTVFIKVDTPQWAHHLDFYKQEIIEKLKEFNIKNIRFKVGRLPEDTDQQAPQNDIRPLSSEDKRFIDDTLSTVHDRELKDRLQQLLIHSLTRGRSIRP